jgi:hypothetical protein
VIEVPGASTEVGRGSLLGRRLTELTADERRRVELIELGERGFTVFRPADLDRRFAPWLVDPAGKVWAVRGGEPRGGRRPETHAVVLEDDATWGWLTAASALQESNTPQSLRELEDRQKRAERAQKRKEQEKQTAIQARRISARPVTFGDLDPGGPETLRQAVEQLDARGGTLRIVGGHLIVNLPPDELGAGPLGSEAYGKKLARYLYLGEVHLVAAAKRGGEIDIERVPNRALLPSGALA